MRLAGLVFIFVALAIPAYLFATITPARDPLALFSQYLGVVALITMAITQIIATRWPGVELLFGGLDRSYVLHKWLGITAMVAILVHDTIDAEMRGLGGGALEDLAETLGELSLYGLLILVVITVATFVPYHLWRWTHKLMGTFFAAGSFHFIFIGKPFAMSDPAGVYTGVFCLLGVLAYAYTLLPAGMRGGRRYAVTQIETMGDTAAITLTPKRGKMRHQAGQFAFVTFDVPGLTEPHPFTISSAPREDGSIRLSVKSMGDFTRRLTRQLETGAEARVVGPYGRFLRHASQAPEIWIAGGIGVTPFAAWLSGELTTKAPVHLFYCLRDEASAPHLEEIREAIKGHDNVTLHEIVSGRDPRLTAERAEELSGVTMSDAKVYFCGPAPMRRSLIDGFAQLGVAQRRFHYEEFEIRTGIGLRRLADWVWGRIAARQGI